MEERGVRPFPGASPGARNRAGEVAEVVGSIPSSRVSRNGVNSKTRLDYKVGGDLGASPGSGICSYSSIGRASEASANPVVVGSNPSSCIRASSSVVRASD